MCDLKCNSSCESWAIYCANHWAAILSICGRVLGCVASAQTAEMLASDVVYDLMPSKNRRPCDIDNMNAWLRKVAKNRLLKQKLAERPCVDYDLDQLTNRSASPDEEAQASDLEEHIFSALTPMEKIIYKCRVTDRLTLEQTVMKCNLRDSELAMMRENLRSKIGRIVGADGNS